jgi:hypothetical protein
MSSNVRQRSTRSIRESPPDSKQELTPVSYCLAQAKKRRILTLSAVGVEKVFFAPECRQMSQDLMTGNVSEIEKAVYRAS